MLNSCKASYITPLRVLRGSFLFYKRKKAMSDDRITIYKIRHKRTNLYCRGRVQKKYGRRNVGKATHEVLWKTNGKEWTTKKALEDHLLKCIEKNIDMSEWEIMEFTQQPHKALNEWFDEKMTFAILKHSK